MHNDEAGMRKKKKKKKKKGGLLGFPKKKIPICLL